MSIFSMLVRSFFHLSHRGRSSSVRGSSQPVPCLHISCSTPFPISKNGATNPKGSYKEATIDSIPLRVAGWSLRLTLNFKQSDSMCHWIPNALSAGRSSKVRLRSLMSDARSDDGMLSKTALSLDTNLWSLRPPRAQSSLASWASWIAFSVLSILATPSST